MVIGKDDTPTVDFPNKNHPVDYWFDLEMTKAGVPETTTQGKMTLTGDVAV